MFLGCLYFTEFPLNIQGTGLLIFAVQYISISLYIFTRYIYFGRFAAWITYSKITRKYTCSLRILLNTVILILHSACMPIIFATYVCWCGALRAVTNTLLFAVFYVCFFMSTVILLIVPLLSISMYSYYIYAYSTLRACSITYLFAIFFYVFL